MKILSGFFYYFVLIFNFVLQKLLLFLVNAILERILFYQCSLDFFLIVER